MDLRGCGVDSFGSENGPVVSSCKHGYEPSGSGVTELVRQVTKPESQITVNEPDFLRVRVYFLTCL
jgi:hypothetical protein